MKLYKAKVIGIDLRTFEANGKTFYSVHLAYKSGDVSGEGTCIIHTSEILKINQEVFVCRFYDNETKRCVCRLVNNV